jgi:hypothetical protein
VEVAVDGGEAVGDAVLGDQAVGDLVDIAQSICVDRAWGFFPSQTEE